MKKNFVAGANNSNTNNTHSSRNEQKDFYSNLSNSTLIPIFNHPTTGKTTVDGRTLHKKLNVQTRFNDWIERRIQEYDFQEGLDFYSNLSKSTGGRRAIDYHLTTIMAQELCLLDNSEIGKNLRRYLLQNFNKSQNKYAMLDELPYLVINDRKLYHYRTLQRLLNYSTKSSISNIRRKYAEQLFVLGRDAYVSEEYAILMIDRATARDRAVQTLTVQPISLSNQLNLF